VLKVPKSVRFSTPSGKGTQGLGIFYFLFKNGADFRHFELLSHAQCALTNHERMVRVR
jgi:hypothetical protein